jgi:hypothetical protein
VGAWEHGGVGENPGHGDAATRGHGVGAWEHGGVGENPGHGDAVTRGLGVKPSAGIAASSRFMRDVIIHPHLSPPI